MSEEKLKECCKLITKLKHAIRESRTDRGAVIIGDKLEAKILNFEYE